MRALRPVHLLLLLLTGCIQLSYDVYYNGEPVTPEAIASLQPGTTDLTTALARLGAPRFVLEHQRDGIVLAWVSREASGWGLEFSYAFERFANASVSLDKEAANLPGLVLWFGPDLTLRDAKTGRLGALLPHVRRPSPSVDDDK
jgi:hypothetical protein